MPHIEAKIVNPAETTVRIGDAGEILVRGYSTMLGYWDDPETTSKTIDSEGSLRTGDLGMFDEGGYGKMVGRIKEHDHQGRRKHFLQRDSRVSTAPPGDRECLRYRGADDMYGEAIRSVCR